MFKKNINAINDFYIFNNDQNINTSALIFLHGYGSSKEDFKSLVPFFSGLRETLLVIPNANSKNFLGNGYQWFEVKIDETNIYFDVNECKISFNLLKKFIENICNEYNIPFKHVGIFGFSQGAVMALTLALLSGYKFGCIIAHSGLFFNCNNELKIFSDTIHKDQNILLIHGVDDLVIPFSYVKKTTKFFIDNNIPFYTYFKKYLGHNVDKTTLLESIKFFQLYCK